MLTADSRQACKDCLFFCKGANFKKEYLEAAIEKGAAAYVSETDYGVSIPCIKVPDIRIAMADMCREFYGDPSASLKLAGITGTKGKSTTLYFLKSIMEHSALCGEGRFGYTSSIDNYDGVTKEESHLTTPEAIELNTLLSNMVGSGIEFAGMEVSSQALKYDRSRGIRFKVGGFTNFSRDHISPGEHSDLEDYFASKLRLIDQCDTFIVNNGFDRAEAVSEACRASLKAGRLKKLVSYSVDFGDGAAPADCTAGNVRKEDGFTCFDVKGCGTYRISMPGLFNVENAVMAILMAKEFGAEEEAIRKGLLCASATGRMEIYKDHERQLVGIVDFAHNKLAFEKIFDSVSKEYAGWHIYSVFGAPGNKAEERRTELPMVAAKYAEYSYITEDDPYLEDPAELCREVFRNLESFGGRGEIIVDREAAVKKAISDAPERTVILFLAKGHDRYMHRKEYDPYVSDSVLVEENI